LLRRYVTSAASLLHTLPEATLNIAFAKNKNYHHCCFHALVNSIVYYLPYRTTFRIPTRVFLHTEIRGRGNVNFFFVKIRSRSNVKVASVFNIKYRNSSSMSVWVLCAYAHAVVYFYPRSYLRFTYYYTYIKTFTFIDISCVVINLNINNITPFIVYAAHSSFNRSFSVLARPPYAFIE